MDKTPARDARGLEFDPLSRHPKMSIFVSHLIVPIFVNYSQKDIRLLKDNHYGVDSQNHRSIFMRKSPIKMFPVPVQIPE